MARSKFQYWGWLERNKIFRFIFLLRKLYLTKTRFIHFSQYAEDVSINRIFYKGCRERYVKGYKGFFVDVGCFHPKKHNNTWSLYKKGWRGINIDIDPIKIWGFNIVRPHDINITCAVSDTEGDVEYYSHGLYALTNSLDENTGKRKSRYEKKIVQARKLTSLIDETKFKDREIDLLSVDAEGYDLQVLSSLNFERYNPKIIAVESHSALFSEISESSLYRFLTSKEYCLVGWCGLTLIMANKSLQEMLSNKA